MTQCSLSTAQPLEETVAQINEAHAGTLRCAKGLVDSARALGRHLAEARDLVGRDAWRAWVIRTPAISPEEAEACLRFIEEPGVMTADVSPARAVTLYAASGWVGLLVDAFRAGPTERGVQPAAERTISDTAPADSPAPPETPRAASHREVDPQLQDFLRDLDSGSESQRAARAVLVLERLAQPGPNGPRDDSAEAQTVRDRVMSRGDRLMVMQAQRLRQRDPALFAEVLAGKVTIPEAISQAKSQRPRV